jgi:Clp amino terminal domain, pathogenicity island component
MFERFTDRGRRVVVLAQEEARLLNHDYIGTEHILLGLIHEGEGVAARALTALGISLEAVRAQVEEIIGQGERPPGGHIPFTPRAKKVLELSLREALALGHNYIGTEHILLGLIREGQGVAAQVLVKLGADHDRVRQQVIQLLAGYVGGDLPEPASLGQPRLGQPVTAGIAGGPGVYQDQPAELVRVVPLAREVYRGYGYRVVLMSLEVWSGWLDLRYALLPADAPPGSTPPEIALDWRISDDAGTAYEVCGLASSGARLLRIHQLSFMPPPSEDARRLTLTAVDANGVKLAVVEIELAPEAEA